MSNQEDKTVDILLAHRPQWDAEPEQSSSAWLISFTDVIALMLTFFVLLYSMSDPVQDKWDDKMGATPDAYARQSGSVGNAGVNEGVNINRVDYAMVDRVDYTEAVLNEVLNAKDMNIPVDLRRLGNDLYLDITPQAFDRGNNFNNEYINIIKILSPLLNNLDNQIIVVGSLKDKGSATAFLRAQTIARTLTLKGYKKPLAIALRGDSTGNDAVLSILIKPHDGRRITR